MGDKKKVKVCTLACPECGKSIDVFKDVEILVAAVKAEKEETYYAEKTVQTTLDQRGGENE